MLNWYTVIRVVLNCSIRTKYKSIFFYKMKYDIQYSNILIQPAWKWPWMKSTSNELDHFSYARVTVSGFHNALTVDGDVITRMLTASMGHGVDMWRSSFWSSFIHKLCHVRNEIICLAAVTREIKSQNNCHSRERINVSPLYSIDNSIYIFFSFLVLIYFHLWKDYSRYHSTHRKTWAVIDFWF